MNGHDHEGQAAGRIPFRLPLWVGFLAFLGIALFFLWGEHRVHILGVLPFALLLLCPALHLFMHGGHGGHDHAPGGQDHAGHASGDRP